MDELGGHYAKQNKSEKDKYCISIIQQSGKGKTIETIIKKKISGCQCLGEGRERGIDRNQRIWGAVKLFCMIL